MLTPEGRVKERVKKLLSEHGAYYHMPVQNGMGSPTLDFIGCHQGRFLAVETKAGDGDMTPRQETTAGKITQSGGVVFLVNAVRGLSELEAWLTQTQ